MSCFLVIIGDREAVGWVLSERRMAFPDARRAESRALDAGDRLLLYTTRGCFKNPTRDRGRVIGTAWALSAAEPLDDPPEFAGRTFPFGIPLELGVLAPFGRGVELAPLVPDLHAFASYGKGWSVRLRRPLVSLDEHDCALLAGAVDGVGIEVDDAAGDYTRWWRRAGRTVREPGSETPLTQSPAPTP